MTERPSPHYKNDPINPRDPLCPNSEAGGRDGCRGLQFERLRDKGVRMQQKKSSFVAYDDRGRPHMIDNYVTITRIVALEGATELEGPGDLRLANGGRFVSRLEPGKYQIIDTGVILTSTMP
jgi:hypothetical protein